MNCLFIMYSSTYDFSLPLQIAMLQIDDDHFSCTHDELLRLDKWRIALIIEITSGTHSLLAYRSLQKKITHIEPNVSSNKV